MNIQKKYRGSVFEGILGDHCSIFVVEIVVQLISNIYHSLEGLPKSPPKRTNGFGGDILSVPCRK
jgi:hypothetical protein